LFRLLRNHAPVVDLGFHCHTSHNGNCITAIKVKPAFDLFAVGRSMLDVAGDTPAATKNKSPAERFRLVFELTKQDCFGTQTTKSKRPAIFRKWSHCFLRRVVPLFRFAYVKDFCLGSNPSRAANRTPRSIEIKTVIKSENSDVSWRDSRAAIVIVCVFLIAMTWFVFGQTVRYDFVNYDDDNYVYANPLISSGLTVSGAIHAFSGKHAGNWHPLTTLSHMWDCQL